MERFGLDRYIIVSACCGVGRFGGIFCFEYVYEGVGMVWWFVIMIVGILVFALLIDWRRKKNNNTTNTPGINSSTKSGESSNYQSGEGRDW